jgi:hypothetical protein
MLGTTLLASAAPPAAHALVAPRPPPDCHYSNQINGEHIPLPLVASLLGMAKALTSSARCRLGHPWSGGEEEGEGREGSPGEDQAAPGKELAQ